MNIGDVKIIKFKGSCKKVIKIRKQNKIGFLSLNLGDC